MKNCTQKEEWYSDTVTAVVVPPYINSSEIVRLAWRRCNMSLGLGLNKVAGKVFRIGHLGNLNEVMLICLIPYSTCCSTLLCNILFSNEKKKGHFSSLPYFLG